MCLSIVNTKKIQDKIKDTIPEGGLIVYKAVRYEDDSYYPVYRYSHLPYRNGLQYAQTEGVILLRPYISYRAGFHFWMTKKDAIRSLIYINKYIRGEQKFIIIECFVKKEWITAIGKDTTTLGEKARAIVTSKAIFPDSATKETTMSKEWIKAIRKNND